MAEIDSVVMTSKGQPGNRDHGVDIDHRSVSGVQTPAVVLRLPAVGRPGWSRERDRGLGQRLV